MALSCDECDRLWEQLADATRAYGQRIHEEQSNNSEPRPYDVAKLARAIRNAAETQQDARRAILEHASTHLTPGRPIVSTETVQDDVSD